MTGNFDSNASSWTESDLRRLGVCYRRRETDFREFMSMLELSNLSREYNLVLHCTRNIWNFSFDFDLRNHANEDQMIAQGKQDAEEILRKLRDIQKRYRYETTNQYHR